MPASSFDYETALIACARGDSDALHRLYRHEARHMLALCQRMLPQSTEAQDVVRDTFVLIWKNSASYTLDSGPARGWIYSILRYRARQKLRHTASQRPFTELSMPTPDPASAHRHSLAHQVQRLPSDQRRPLLLAFYQGLSYSEIAQRMHRPIDEIKRCVQEALLDLQEVVPA